MWFARFANGAPVLLTKEVNNSVLEEPLVPIPTGGQACCLGQVYVGQEQAFDPG